VETTTISRYLDQFPPQERLPRVFSGSWIDHKFSIWIGHEEDRTAWNYLHRTRRFLVSKQQSGAVDEKTARRAWEEIYIAEGSDWFWWYGDDHVTDFALEFDALFRDHLIAIYQLLNIHPPADLFIPIIAHKSTSSFMVKPQAPIHPHIDGKQSSFFEWIGSGSIDETRLFSTMDRVRGPIAKIYYGHNKEHAFVAFEGEIAKLMQDNVKLQIIIEETEQNYTLEIGGDNSKAPVVCAIGDSIELAFPIVMFGDHARVHLRFEFEQNDTILQTLPGYGALQIDTDEDYTENWFV
jgi:alpha-amylase/alpha-mannosidase (GH57 family)